MAKFSHWHLTNAPFDISLEDFDFNSQKGNHQERPSSNTLKCSNYSGTRYRLGQCRAHLRWLPRTWHQSGFRTGLASEKCGGAPACHNMPATGLKMLQVCQRKKAQETRVHNKKNTPRRETKRLSCKHITWYLTSGLPGRAQAHAWLRGKLNAKGKDFEDAWGLPEEDNFHATSIRLDSTTQQANSRQM